MHIKNRLQLEPKSLNSNLKILRKIALNALEIGLSAINPEKLINDNLKLEGTRLIVNGDDFNLEQFKKIHIIGAGKAVLGMLIALEKLFIRNGIKNYDGVINIPKGSLNELNLSSNRVTIIEASHPFPDNIGLKGTKLMMNILNDASDNDLICCLISGGGSSLLVFPRRGVSLKSLKKVNSLLLASGASIQEINIVRKYLSRVKGGKLAQALSRSSKATMISLIISDVIGDDLQIIASGPTVLNHSTPLDALKVLEKYNLIEKIPHSIFNVLKESKLQEWEYRPLEIRNVYNYLIGSVKNAVIEITNFIKSNGFRVVQFSGHISGEARKFGRILGDLIVGPNDNLPQLGSENLAFIGSGELTVTVKGNGIGGRNQEMLLSFLDYAMEQEIKYEFLVMAINFDGLDGNSDAIGALVDNQVINDAQKYKLIPLEYLKDNNSNLYFKQLSTDIITGFTGCNVNDMLLVLVSKK